ncbi:lactococcin-G-processing and transport ATP-binding protein LagD [Thomasclavelia cocleata]|uniref:Lactococcin-G-processing and transport ATP-binding protein LagD n=2 Tax=Thomasclavelia cocleata TaxID=69824 RepID=A0A829ZD55_9FIRM|nr:cysteine peptidase family C39 domain-containing protein [Thomasclavelia cocleata]GFI42049.1 lactococcin-G-processing and transport ATP-binding protein LagD [Thomasclavelia cocleata]
MYKYPIYKQDNNYSCGAYCIKMILKYHHLDIKIKEIKERCRLTSEGISVYGLVRCLQSYHFDVKAYQCDFNILLDEARLPCIIHVVRDNMTHFVVLYQITKKYLIIGDPAKGLTKLSYEEVESVFSGVCVCINHVGRYMVKKEQKEISFREFIIQHLKSNYRYIVKLLSKALFISMCSIISSFYFQILINTIDEVNYYFIIAFNAVFIFIAGVRVLLNYQRKNLEIEIQKKLNYEYVNKTVLHMLYLPFKYFNCNQEGVLLTKVQNLYSLSNFFIHFYLVVFMDVILMLGIIMALLIFSFQIGLSVVVILGIIALVVLNGMKKLNELNKKIIGSQEEMNQGYLEYLKNFYNSHQFFLKQFTKEKINFLFDEYNLNVYWRDKNLNSLNVVSEMLIQGLSFLVVLVACYFYKQGKINVGDIVFFYMLTTYLIEPLFNFIALVFERDEVKILYERYKEVIPDKSERKLKIKGRIREIKFDHITYSYGYKEPIIEHLDLVINSSLWLKGDTGAGKSTLLKLLMKHDDLIKGNILINGVSLTRIDSSSLYRKIIYIDKEPIFYQESLKFNLLLKNNNQRLLEKLLKEFELENFIDKLEMMIEIDGKPLSSGQRQIMMIIRALLLKPEVLILDEALSNVDDHKMYKILNYINNYRKEIIVVIVAHQTKLVNQFYDCAIIKDGKIYK